MILPVRYSADGSIVTAADVSSDEVYIRLFLSGKETVIRNFTVGEVEAFIEYLGCNLRFQIGDWFVELTETSRDALISDLEHATRYLGAVA